MKFSTKTRYGLRAVLEIARNGDCPLKRKEIAAIQEVSDSYLENILIVLKSNRIIETIRGANGGYVLSRSPSQITVMEIVEALEGPLDLVECTFSPSVCRKSDQCITRSIWKELADSWRSILGNKTIADLLEKEMSKVTCYSI